MIDFNTVLDHRIVRDVGLILLVWVIGGVVFNLIRWWPIIWPSLTRDKRENGGRSLLRAVGKTAVWNVLFQLNLRGCSLRKWVSHLAVFWGFVILGLSTTLNYLANPTAVPLQMDHPVRILGNTGGLLFMFGLTLMIWERVASPGVRSSTSAGEALFIVLLYAAGLSGFLTEVSSETGLIAITAVLYWAHLATVAALFILAPFSKFIHAFGRFLINLFENTEQPLTPSNERRERVP